MLQEARMTVEVHGMVEPRFAAVRDAFAANFTLHGDVGAACAVYHRGRLVVDVWGGLADRATARPWTRGTLALVFSTTKGLAATCVLRLVEQGLLDLDAPIARYWPEFGAAGKAAVPVRWALCHKTGLADVTGTFTLEEIFAWKPVVAAIAAQAPNWEPGTQHGYHARSFGWITGELVRRVTGRSFGRYVAEEIAAPLGLELWVGLPEALEPRVATLVPAPEPDDPAVREMLARFMGPDTLLGRVLRGPSDLFAYDERWNRPPFHAAEMPSSNGIGTARAIARLYATLAGDVDGVRCLRPETVALARSVQADGPDAVLMLPTRFGLGFMLPPALSLAAAPTAFGHPGAGGSLGFADPEAELGFGYVMNQMQLGTTGDPRSRGLVEAVYAAL
jgi:CubicO group peptidase (beta-lactamase class C family)